MVVFILSWENGKLKILWTANTLQSIQLYFVLCLGIRIKEWKSQISTLIKNIVIIICEKQLYFSTGYSDKASLAIVLVVSTFVFTSNCFLKRTYTDEWILHRFYLIAEYYALMLKRPRGRLFRRPYRQEYCEGITGPNFIRSSNA